MTVFFTQLLRHGQNMTEGKFLRGEEMVWIEFEFSFL